MKFDLIKSNIYKYFPSASFVYNYQDKFKSFFDGAYSGKIKTKSGIDLGSGINEDEAWINAYENLQIEGFALETEDLSDCVMCKYNNILNKDTYKCDSCSDYNNFEM